LAVPPAPLWARERRRARALGPAQGQLLVVAPVQALEQGPP